MTSARDREMALEVALTDKQIEKIAAALAQARAEEREACRTAAVRAVGGCYVGTDKDSREVLYSCDVEGVVDAAIRARSTQEGE